MTGLDDLYERVDEIQEIVDERRPTFFRRKPIDVLVLKSILGIMGAVPEGQKRELVWQLMLQGTDRKILSRATRLAAASYRTWTAQHAPEVERPEDAMPYKYDMKEIPESIRDIMDPGDPIGACLQHGFSDIGHEEDFGDGHGLERIGGQDEMIVDDDIAYVMMMDGWVWRVNLENGHAEPFTKPPRMPAGAARRAREDDKIYFCACRWTYRFPPAAGAVGIYVMDTTSAAEDKWESVVLRVPWREGSEWGSRAYEPDPDPTVGKVYTRQEMDDNQVSFADLRDLRKSRPICYPNDLAISDDGQYLFFTEPSPYTSMGPGSRPEITNLTRNARLWRVDLENETISLAAEGFSFLDGVLVEKGGISVLVNELARFRLLRLDFAKGEGQEIWRDLPGMPDGMTRDADDRIWLALLHKRSWAIAFVHRHPWAKRIYNRLPFQIPAPRQTGFLVLDGKTQEPIYGAMHPGSKVTHIASVVPTRRGIFFPIFEPHNRGLKWIPDPTHG